MYLTVFIELKIRNNSEMPAIFFSINLFFNKDYSDFKVIQYFMSLS